MNVKYLILVSLMLTIFTIGIVSASETSDNLTVDNVIDEGISESSDDNITLTKDEIEINNVEGNLGSAGSEIISDGEYKSFDEIKLLLENAAPGSTIKLSGYYIGSGYQFSIDKELIIEGDGKTYLNANNQSRVFTASSTKVTFKNLIFIDCYTYGSGGAISSTFSDLEIINCSFYNCHADCDGGAFSMFDGKVTIINCNFYNNYAVDNGGSIENYGGTLDVIGSNFYNNVVTCEDIRNGEGGAITNKGGILTVFDSKFYNNRAYMAGGAIRNKGEGVTNVLNSYFEGNNVRNRFGGALFYCNAFECEFVQNTARYNGGGMYLGNALDCTFRGNYPDAFYNTVVKYTPKFTLSKQTIVYGEKLNVKVTYNGGNPVNGTLVKIKIKIGNDYKYYYAKTNANGIASFALTVAPKTYNEVVISIDQVDMSNPDQSILGANKTVKLVIKKDTPKITASAKQFKVKAKKTYKITVKNSKGSVIKNTNVKIKVNGVTYSAKTNSKGQATFTLSKLSKKGSFKSTITFVSNTYYNKVTKTVTLKVK